MPTAHRYAGAVSPTSIGAPDPVAAPREDADPQSASSSRKISTSRYKHEPTPEEQYTNGYKHKEMKKG